MARPRGGVPQILKTGLVMQRARIQGVGLPNVADVENPYRVMLGEQADGVRRLFPDFGGAKTEQ